MCKVITFANQKGGVAKTTSCLNLGVALVKSGYRVLLIDADPQGSLTAHAGLMPLPTTLEYSLNEILKNVIAQVDWDGSECPINAPPDGILSHEEGFDIMPCDIRLASLEVEMAEVKETMRLGIFTTKNTILKLWVDIVKQNCNYDYILIDSNPSLHLLTINALACADYVLIPTQAQFLSIQGLQLLIRTINSVRNNLNPRLKILGVLFTITEKHTNFAKETMQLVEEVYGASIHFFPSDIPKTIRIAESSAAGKSIFAYAPRSKAAQRYATLAEQITEILNSK